MINTTSKCSCGADKPNRVQWCGDCWERIPEDHKAIYLKGAGAIHAGINLCEQELRKSKEAGKCS